MARVLLYDQIAGKRCGRCGAVKHPAAFNREASKADGLRGYCRPCQKEYQRAWQYRSRFGITVDDYDRMFARQGGVCAVCKRPPKKNHLAVDHDHLTGEIRGLLCPPCNRSVEWLILYGDGARDYLLGKI